MASVRLGPFLGAYKGLRPKLLPNNAAVNSLNHWPERGDLRPWKVPLNEKLVSFLTKTFYMLGRDATTDTVYWLVWNTIVHAVRTFRSTDTTKRTYYTGDGAPKVTDNILGLAGEPYPTSYRDLGVPKPSTKMTVTQTVAGTGTDETRFYAYTYLTDWDEEGPPNVSDAVTCKPGANFNITTLAAPPSGAGNNRGINRIRIYRTLTGDAGSSFYFLRDVALPATSTTDNAIAPGSDTLPSTQYYPPPTDLKYLTALWNGILAGISGKAVRYSEINRPHAWPAAYETLLADTPVALAVFEKNLVVLTTGRPRIVVGSVPEAMDDDPVEFIAACVAPRSAVSVSHGVCWATKDGLAYIGRNGAPRLLTEGLMAPEDWRALSPETMVGSYYRGRYFCFYNAAVGGLGGFSIDPLKPEEGLYFISPAYCGTATFYDPLEEQMYVLGTDNYIKKWNAGASSMTASFESKTFRMPSPVNMAIAELIADTYPATFTLYADSRPAWTKTVTSKVPFTLPSGYLADDWKVKIETATDVTGFVMAETLDELKQQ